MMASSVSELTELSLAVWWSLSDKHFFICLFCFGFSFGLYICFAPLFGCVADCLSATASIFLGSWNVLWCFLALHCAFSGSWPVFVWHRALASPSSALGLLRLGQKSWPVDPRACSWVRRGTEEEDRRKKKTLFRDVELVGFTEGHKERGQCLAG